MGTAMDMAGRTKHNVAAAVMPEHGHRFTRSWWWRTLIVVLTVTIAAASAMLSASLYLSRIDPVRAVALWPGNSLARANMASNGLLAKMQRSSAPAARAAASAALTAQPGNVAAARVMALAASLNGDEPRALRWLRYGEQQSRRDLSTQLALIEYAVNRGEIAEALRHYDRALRTEPESYQQLFPILFAASAEAAVREPLIALLRQRPFWREFFLSQLTGGPTPFAITAPIVAAVSLDPAVPREREILSRTITKGVGENRLAAARRFVPGPASIGIRNGGFEASNNWPPFDWALADDAELGSVIEQGVRDGRGSALFLDARNGRSGEVAHQAEVLPAGRYMLTLAAGDVTGAMDERPLVTIRCAGSNTALLTWRLPTLPTAGAQLRAPFTVPQGCTGQLLSITASSPANEGTDAPRPWIDDVAVKMARSTS